MSAGLAERTTLPVPVVLYDDPHELPVDTGMPALGYTVGPWGPVGPVLPAVPAGPVGPVLPVDPAVPVGPVGPALPTAPVGPVGPATEDAAPVDPVGPVGPVVPFGPVGPATEDAAPVGPVGPVPLGPVGPVPPDVPVGPVGPVLPVDPAVPVGPVGPALPLVPAGPVGPVVPVGPVGPTRVEAAVVCTELSGNLNPPTVLWTDGATKLVPSKVKLDDPANAPALLYCTWVSLPPGTAAGAADTQLVPLLVRTLPVVPATVSPVPPCVADNAVVSPEIEVISELAPFAAAEMLLRAEAALAAVNSDCPTALAPRSTCAAA